MLSYQLLLFVLQLEKHSPAEKPSESQTAESEPRTTEQDKPSMDDLKLLEEEAKVARQYAMELKEKV